MTKKINPPTDINQTTAPAVSDKHGLPDIASFHRGSAFRLSSQRRAVCLLKGYSPRAMGVILISGYWLSIFRNGIYFSA